MRINYFTRRFRNKIKDFCNVNYEKIDVLPGDINFYYKCHLVSSHHAIASKHEKTALVIHESNNNGLSIVHFVNYDGNNFIDNTLGCWTVENEYRFIRWVHKDEFLKVQNILADTQNMFATKATFLEKLFADTWE